MGHMKAPAIAAQDVMVVGAIGRRCNAAADRGRGSFPVVAPPDQVSGRRRWSQPSLASGRSGGNDQSCTAARPPAGGAQKGSRSNNRIERLVAVQTGRSPGRGGDAS